MKLKLRLKKSIFAFFKDEILEYTNYNSRNVENVKIVSKELKFVELKSEFLLNDENLQYCGVPMKIEYERLLDNAKKKLFTECEKFIKIDESALVKSDIYPHRALRLSLFVGTNI